jgi:hypothetical protein
MNGTKHADFATGFQPVIRVAISIRPLHADDFDIEEAFGFSAKTRNKNQPT